MKAGAAIAAAAAGVALTAAPAAFAATTGQGPTLGGTATLSGSSGPLTSGNLNTPFLISLSSPGVCSATSSNPAPQEFAYGFIVPPPAQNTTLAAEMAGVDWQNGAGSSYDPVYFDSTPAQYGPSNTSTTGQPLPPPGGAEFTFGYTDTVLKNNSLTPLENGTWEVGIACVGGSNGNTTTDFWSMPVTFDGSGNWTASSGTAAPEVPMAIILPAAAVGLLGGSVIFARRRNRKTATATA